MMLDCDDPDNVRMLEVDQGEVEATQMDSPHAVRAGAAGGWEGRNQVRSACELVDECGSEPWRFRLVVLKRSDELLVRRRRELDDQLASESASGLSQDLLGGNRLHLAGLQRIDPAPDLRIPCGFHIRIARQARHQPLSELRPFFRAQL